MEVSKMRIIINNHSSYKQKRKVMLAALMLPCISVACGLAAQQKVITHQVDSEFISQQENYSTIVCDFFSKLSKTKYKLASIDGKKIQITPKATDHYRLKPGRHTVAFEEVDISGCRLYKKDIIFESVAGVKYVFTKEEICVSKKEGSNKILKFFSYYQMKIKEEHSSRIVNYPIDGEFQPIIGKGTRAGLSFPPMLHLHDGAELQDDKIARLNLWAGGLRAAYILSLFKEISGTSIDGSKIIYDNSQGQIHTNLYSQFALFPGIYSIGFSSGNLSLHALAGNSYQIKYREPETSIFSSTRKYEVYIEKVTEQAK
jgi:hypothetical protein